MWKLYFLFSILIVVVNKTSSNLIIHPSLGDYFVENLRDYIYVPSNNVISKKLSSPFCSSCDVTDCHHLNVTSLVSGDSTQNPTQETNERKKKKQKKKRRRNKENEEEEEEEEERETSSDQDMKYIYLHTTPFFTMIEPSGKKEYINNVKENKQDGMNQQDMKEIKKGILSRFVSFLFDSVFFFYKKSENKLKDPEHLYVPYFIDRRKTNILNDYSEEMHERDSKSVINDESTTLYYNTTHDNSNSNNHFGSNHHKYKIKGLFLAEHLGETNTFSFLTNLSLVTDIIDFTRVFKYAWKNSFTNDVFLKKEEEELYKDMNKGGEEAEKQLHEKKENVEKEFTEKNNYGNDSKNMNEIIDKKHNIQTTNVNHDQSNELMNQLMYTNFYKQDINSQWKEHNVHIGMTDQILEELNIKQQHNIQQVLNNNKKMNIGLCTMERNGKKKKKKKIKFHLKRKILKDTRKEIKKENHASCIFFTSIDHSDIFFNLKKAPYKEKQKEENHTGKMDTFSISHDSIYKEWIKKRSHGNYSKIDMISMNMLKNIKELKDVTYKKDLYKLQINYNGICKYIVFSYKPNKQRFLEFMFRLHVCLNWDFIDSNVEAKYLNSSKNTNIQLKGMWNIEIKEKSINDVGTKVNKKYNKNNEKQSKEKEEKEKNPFHFSEDSYIYNELYDLRKLNHNKDEQEEHFHSFDGTHSSKGTVYLHEHILNYKVNSSERFKRMKLLGSNHHMFNEKYESSFLINKIIKEQDTILLISKKGTILFDEPIVLTELLVGFKRNPLFNLNCDFKNFPKNRRDSNNAIIENDDIRKKEMIQNKESNHNEQQLLINQERNGNIKGVEKKKNLSLFNTYIANRRKCISRSIHYVYITFNFFLNNNKKFNIKLEVQMDYKSKFENTTDTPFKYINVLKYLRNNINYYRINRIEIEYSFSPFFSLPHFPNEFFNHQYIPFYLSIHNMTINKSKKVYQYVPILFSSKGNFLQVLCRNTPNPVASNHNNNNNNNNNNIQEHNKENEQKEETQNDVNTNNVEDEVEKEKEHILSYSKKWFKLFQSDYNGIEEEEEEEREKEATQHITKNSFSLFTNLPISIFLNHVIQFECSSTQCVYSDSTKRQLLEKGNIENRKEKKWIKNRMSKLRKGEGGTTHIFNYISNSVKVVPWEENNKNKIIEKEKRKKEKERFSSIQKEYFKSLKQNFAKFLKEEQRIITAYNMNQLYSYEFISEKYVIPPYNKGILMNYEIENERIIIDPINNFSYIKEKPIEHFYNDTRKASDVFYIYSALLPIESDLYSLNFLSDNELTIKRIQGENAKMLFKNVVPFTKYEDFYETTKVFSDKLFDLSVFNFSTIPFNNEILNVEIQDNIYKTKIIEIMSNPKNTLQVNSDEKTN